MPAAERSPDRPGSDPGSPSGLYVKHDLFPIKSDREDDDDMEHQPILKLARYAASPVFHHQPNFFEAQRQSSPLPRRKQARPRRRSGDSSSSNTSPMSLPEPHFKLLVSTPSPVQDAPEDLSVKKSPAERQTSYEMELRSETPQSVNSAKENTSSESTRNDFERKSFEPLGPSIPSLLSSIIANSQPTTPASNNVLNLSMHQQDRRKGQHSAPRGGPPRAWTNGDLTEALNQVWNRKMTTSQASRVFGIPYNSLLMYVRGKYGKSLKLDTLRKETLEGEAMALAASTRGSYKLAALAAAAASSSGSPVLPPNPAKSAKPSKSSNANSPTAGSVPAPPPISAKTTVNNNNNTDTVNNNNTNNSNAKTAQKSAPLLKTPPLPGHLNLPNFPAHLNEMDALSMAHSLAGLGGFGGVNPYLSYFCDFSFPMPLALGGLLPPAPKAMRPADGLLKKATELRPDEPKKPKKLAKPDVKTDTNGSSAEEKVERTKNPIPLLRPLIPASLDMSQTGQV